MRSEAHERFWRTYEALSKHGACDSPGGNEYQRVLAEWDKAGQPEPCSEFIRRRANIGPFGEEPPATTQ